MKKLFIILATIAALFVPMQTALAVFKIPDNKEIRILFDKKEFDCLVRNIYFESRGESKSGQEAVALVTLNRVKAKEFPDTVCATVYQYKQFSWTLDKKLKVRDTKAWKAAQNVAYSVLVGKHSLGEFKAKYFHAYYVSPNWGKQKIARIGSHIFYA